MERKITFAQYGCGKMAKYLLRYAIEKGAELVAAFDINPAVLGKDASEIVAEDYPKTGVCVSPAEKAEEILGSLKPDVCIIATRSTVAELEDILRSVRSMASMRLRPARRRCIPGIPHRL